jgi:hypothetical protein
VIDCPCGHVLRGPDDDALFRLARQHVTDHHQDMKRTDEQLRQLVSERARDDLVMMRDPASAVEPPRGA